VITDEDKAALGDLAMRAIDAILEEYGEDAELCAATLVFEVRTKDEDGDDLWHGNYRSLPDTSPNHAVGLLYTTARWIEAS
jgi:hypothetical protein